jgi:hypothetical protein
MKSNLFSNSKLEKVLLLEMSCKKLDAPAKNALLNIQIFFDLKLGEIKKKKHFDVLMSLKIKCCEEEDGADKLFSLYYNLKAKYSTSKIGNVTEKNLLKESSFFMGELYLFTRDDINNALNKMNIKFQMPYSIPEGLKVVPNTHE